MAFPSNTKKGDALENAVKLIIESVLTSDPQYKSQKFAVATKVRDMATGVPNEIDVLVTVGAGTDYEAKFIFECKNWKEPVGKDIVQLFSKVVDEVQATRGFLVARSITKHASDQIEREGRVRFIRCSEDFVSPLNSMELLHTELDVFPPCVVIKWRNYSSGETSIRLDPYKVAVRLNGITVNFISHISCEIDEMAEQVRKEYAFKFYNPGVHWIETGRGTDYWPGELIIDGHDVETVVVPFRAFIKCQQRKLISKFELEGKGQAFTFEPIDTGDPQKPLEIQIVTRFKGSK